MILTPGVILACILGLALLAYSPARRGILTVATCAVIAYFFMPVAGVFSTLRPAERPAQTVVVSSRDVPPPHEVSTALVSPSEVVLQDIRVVSPGPGVRGRVEGTIVNPSAYTVDRLLVQVTWETTSPPGRRLRHHCTASVRVTVAPQGQARFSGAVRLPWDSRLRNGPWHAVVRTVYAREPD